MYNLEIDPETGRTNSTTKGKEEAILKRVERVEIPLEIKPRMSMGGRDIMGMERGKKQTLPLGSPHGEDELQ